MPSLPYLRRPRRARQRLHDDQDLLDALLKIVGVPVAACAADGTLTYANRPTCELLRMDGALGSSPESWIAELCPRTASGIRLLREDLPPVRALEGETVRGVEVLVSVQGSDLLLSTNASPVNDEKGRRRGAVLVMEDVTKQRRRERRLRSCLGALDVDPKDPC